MQGFVVGLQARMGIVLRLVDSDVQIECVVDTGIEREIAVLGLGHGPLIGTALLEGYHLSIDFCDGGNDIL